jgi:hypothetical protein
MVDWLVERIVHFEPQDFVREGLAHFGFHLSDGRYCAIDHPRHRVAVVREDGALDELSAPFSYPIYADVLDDGSVIVANFGDARIYRFPDHGRGAAELLVDGKPLGLVDMGNCVVGPDGCIWVNEVTGCRLRRFDRTGTLLETLGDATPGLQVQSAFADARFGWIYDLRRGADDRLYVLDSGNFAVRVLDVDSRTVRLLAGCGAAGYAGDGGPARDATFGGDDAAQFNGPISLSLDEVGNVFVGDRFNRVVRIIERENGCIRTIAGRAGVPTAAANDPRERNPLLVDLPQISSMDYDRGRLFVPTDLEDGTGDLVVLRRAS